MKTLVIFDIDGTLLYSNKIDSQCFADTYRKIYKRAFPSIDWSRYPHVTDDTIFHSVISQHFDRIASEDEKDYFREHFVSLIKERRDDCPDEFKQVAGAREAVEQLKADERFLVGIGTGGWRKPARVKLNHVGIALDGIHDAYADGHETRESILQESIDKARRACEDLENIVYVGDAKWDVATTRNMNIPFVGIARNGDRQMLSQLGANQVLDNFSDFDTFLAALGEARVPGKV